MTALTPTHERLADRITLAVLFAITAAGLTVIAGWHLHFASIIHILPGAIAIQYNSAVCFVVLGLSGMIAIRFPNCRSVLMIGSCFITILSLMVVVEFLSGRSLGIDVAFFHPWDTILNQYPGRMSLITAISFMASGIALITVAVGNQRTYAFFAIAHTLPLSLGLSSLIGYVLGITFLIPFAMGSQMAVQTAATFTIYGGLMIHYAWRNSAVEAGGLPNWIPGMAAMVIPFLSVAFSATTQSSSHSVITNLLLALGSAVLLGIGIRKLISVKMAYKGLILTSIPLIFLMIFVGLVIQIKRSSEDAQAWSLHSKDVINKVA